MTTEVLEKAAPAVGLIPRTSVSKRIKIVHASGEFSDDLDKARSDLRSLFELNAVILSGTESGDAPRKKMMREELHDEGYHHFIPNPTDGWVAIHKNFTGFCPIEVRYEKVLNSSHDAGDPHPYDEKGIIQMAFKHATLGWLTMVGGGHYLTLGREPGQAQKDAPGDPVHHREANKRLARAMADACIQASGGAGIAFFAADTNLVDKDEDVFFGKPLTTCWDELGKWPDTGHGNIDVIGSVNADKRVSIHNAYVLDDKDFPQFSDHFVVVAEYDIRKLS